MGRHRRATPAPTRPAGPASGTRDRGRHRGAAHRRKQSTMPVRTGLLSASAAMAMGAVAVASGLLPGPGGTYIDGSQGPDDRVRTGGLPDLSTQGTQTSPDERGTPMTGRDQTRTPSPRATPKAPTPETSKPQRPGATTAPSETEQEATPSESQAPPDSTPSSPSASAEPSTPTETALDRASAAEAEVVRLVNEERAAAGCSPLTADPDLAGLARDFSRDMAEEGFFSHVSPDGASPWDRAKDLGIDNLAAENIARGQADARAVVKAWMDSPGHRANILNCEYRTLGVGVHFGAEGPWWTQSFGF